VTVRQEALDSGELNNAPEEKIKQAFRLLRDDPERGKPLRRRLTGCRSLRIGGSENRLVYRYHRDVDLVEILALERRRDDQAYATAESRL
jgi:mRNA-degrading endonuclease RelE of RelBE toxin-antitoxin system